MTIHKIGSDLVRPSGPKGPQRGSTSSTNGDSEEVRRVERADRVEISPEGRELAAQLLSESSEPAGGRQDVIAVRLGHGYYNDPAVAKDVAGRLLASGDLDVHA